MSLRDWKDTVEDGFGTRLLASVGGGFYEGSGGAMKELLTRLWGRRLQAEIQDLLVPPGI